MPDQDQGKKPSNFLVAIDQATAPKIPVGVKAHVDDIVTHAKGGAGLQHIEYNTGLLSRLDASHFCKAQADNNRRETTLFHVPVLGDFNYRHQAENVTSSIGFTGMDVSGHKVAGVACEGDQTGVTVKTRVLPTVKPKP